MPNTFITPSIVAKEALMQLESNMVMANLVHTDYSKEFARVGDTVTVRKPATFTAKTFLNEVSAQDITEGSVPVKLDRHRDVTVQVTSKEMTLNIQDFSKQVIEPAMLALATQVDADLLATGIGGAGKINKATVSPTNLVDIAELAKALDKNLAPQQNRRMVFSPDHKYRYALTDNLSKVSYAGDNETLRDALLGRVYGFDSYMDQNCPYGAVATAGTATAFKVAGTEGETTVALSGMSAATATVKAGEGFIVDGEFYKFTADGTGTSNAIASIGIDHPLRETITTPKDAVLIKGANSLAFHKNGLALVTRQLELPAGAAKAAIASANGLSVRVVYDYDSTHKRDTVSFDILYGCAALEKNLLVGLAD